jgi:hypothetical protein
MRGGGGVWAGGDGGWACGRGADVSGIERKRTKILGPGLYHSCVRSIINGNDKFVWVHVLKKPKTEDDASTQTFIRSIENWRVIIPLVDPPVFRN